MRVSVCAVPTRVHATRLVTDVEGAALRSGMRGEGGRVVEPAAAGGQDVRHRAS